MKTITALFLLLATTAAVADYSTIVMTPSGPVTCQNINGTTVCQ